MRHNQLENTSIEVSESFKNLYSAMPAYLVKMINWTWAVGLHDLSTDSGEYSAGTLECLRRVINLAEENNILMPDITLFAQSAYDERGGYRGWGKRRNPEFYESAFIKLS